MRKHVSIAGGLGVSLLGALLLLAQFAPGLFASSQSEPPASPRPDAVGTEAPVLPDPPAGAVPPPPPQPPAAPPVVVPPRAPSSPERGLSAPRTDPRAASGAPPVGPAVSPSPYGMHPPAAAPRSAWTIPADAESARQGQEFARLDAECILLAQQYRDMAAQGAPPTPLLEMHERLRRMVEQAFDARKQYQGRQLERLKERLTKVEEHLKLREQERAAIVASRLKELLAEGAPLRWDFDPLATSGTPASAAPNEVMMVQVPIYAPPPATLTPAPALAKVPGPVPENQFGLRLPEPASASGGPAARERASPMNANVPIQTGTSSAGPAAASPTLALLDATARELEQQMQSFAQLAERLGADHPSVVDARKSVLLVRRRLAEQLELSKFDMAEARLMLQVPTSKLNELQEVQRRAPGSVPGATMETLKLEAELAKVRLDRLEHLMNHYRRLMKQPLLTPSSNDPF